jgi:uncharacterized protein (UPF0333 family)
MTYALQILLAVVISSLTVVLIIIGIEFFFILKEMRESIKKMNQIIDDTHTVTKTVSKGVEDTAGFLSGLKKGAGMFGAIKKFARSLDEEED